MKLHLIYPGGLQYQPQWWQNFINDIDVQYIHQPRTIERTTNIHTEIKKAGAKPFYTNPEDISSIIGLEFEQIPVELYDNLVSGHEYDRFRIFHFKSEAHYTWFILRWS